jgi:predicted RNase H-like HicB family nuclease
MKERYSFIAILDYADDGISISFPDLPGCLPCADTQDEAIHNAQEALGLHLYGMEQDGDPIPEPTALHDIPLEKDQVPLLVSVYMPAVRGQVQSVFVKKTLTIPAWLNDAALRQGINFSQTLQQALKEQLHIYA